VGTDSGGVLGEATDQMLEAAGMRAGAEVLDVAAGTSGQTLGFETAGGFVGPCELLIGSGVK
jgi:ubiquinone/menaquinone biosynthesis C-methylase UbiE